MKKLIVFVCHGNIHRSVVAEIFLKQLLATDKSSKSFTVISMGTQRTQTRYSNLTQYLTEWTASEPSLRELGVDLHKFRTHISRPLTETVMNHAAIAVVMTPEILAEAQKLFPAHSTKLVLFNDLADKKTELPDCFDSDDIARHAHVNTEIVTILRNSYKKLLAMI